MWTTLWQRLYFQSEMLSIQWLVVDVGELSILTKLTDILGSWTLLNRQPPLLRNVDIIIIAVITFWFSFFNKFCLWQLQYRSNIRDGNSFVSYSVDCYRKQKSQEMYWCTVLITSIPCFTHIIVHTCTEIVMNWPRIIKCHLHYCWWSCV